MLNTTAHCEFVEHDSNYMYNATAFSRGGRSPVVARLAPSERHVGLYNKTNSGHVCA